MSLIDLVTRAIGKQASSDENRLQLEGAKLASEKRTMERRLRAGGMSQTEAKKAVAAFYGQNKG